MDKCVQFMGLVDRIGPNVKSLHIGQRVVASFHIACGQCRYCKQKLSSFCDRTNSQYYCFLFTCYHEKICLVLIL
jgi:threonine dehydrogenase-like Zn-dependent dehydrogenase